MARTDYVDQIKRIPIKDVVSRLGIKLTKTGNSLQGHCPTGHSSKGGKCFSVNLEQNYFYCFQCGTAGDVITLVEITKNIDFKEAVKWIADEFNIILPEKVKSDSHQFDQKLYENAAIFETLFKYGKYLLYEADGAEARHYLVNDRGYDLEKLKQTEWMFFPPDDSIKHHLINKYPDLKNQINKLPLNSFKEITYWAAFPYRNRDGLITGFLKRALNPEGITVTTFRGERLDNLRWHSTYGTNKYDLFNLDKCKGQNTLVIVEGYPDALYLPTLGLENIVAVGQGKLSKSHLEGLNEFGVRYVIISYDNDPPNDKGVSPGFENTKEAVKLLLKETGINVFVINPPKLGGYKDPDEFVRANGIDDFYDLIDDAESGAKWLAKVNLEQYDLSKDLKKQEALDASCELVESIKSRIAADQFMEEVADKLTMTVETVKEYIGDYRERIARSKLSKEFKKLNQKAEQLRKSGDLEAASKLIETKGTELKNELYKTKIQPVTPLADRLREKHNIERMRTAKFLGYPLTKFSKLASNIDGLQPGLYIIGAETNIGKTAMLTNLGLDVIQTNPDVNMLYFSLDDNWNVIVNRFLGILTEIDLNKVQRQQTDPDNVQKIKNAYDYLISLTEEERLHVKDLGEVNTFNQAEAVIRELYSDKLVVLLDGLFNLEVDNVNASIREQNVQRALRLKALVDVYRIPLICTAELRKKMKSESKDKEPTNDDIMETGKFAYNANITWLLSSLSSDLLDPDEVPVKMRYDKNKLSHYKGYQELRFIKRKGIVEEVADIPLPFNNNISKQTTGGDIEF